MRILVIGGTGTVGRPTVAELLRRGHSVVVFSRSGAPGQPGAEGFAGNLTTGEGLVAALAGVEAVVDCADLAARRPAAVRALEGSTCRLAEYAVKAGVRHCVVLSIVGIDQVPTGYYAGKLVQERTALEGPVPATVLRATQFHEFTGRMVRRGGMGPLAFVPVIRTQPIAAAAVAGALADIAEAPAVGRAPDVGGPRVERLPELARALVRAQRRRVVVVPVPVPGATGRAIRDGGLLLGPNGAVRGPSFMDWLSDGR